MSKSSSSGTTISACSGMTPSESAGTVMVLPEAVKVSLLIVMIVFEVVSAGLAVGAIVGVDSDDPDGLAFGLGRGRGLAGADMARSGFSR